MIDLHTNKTPGLPNRLLLAFSLIVPLLLWSSPALSQDAAQFEPEPIEEEEPPGEEPEPADEVPFDPDAIDETTPGDDLDAEAQPGKPPSQKVLWQDIVAVPRKDVLKSGRFELTPLFGINVNDPIIGHYALGGELNYYLSDILWVGVAGQKFFKDQHDVEFDVRYTYRLAPRVNQYDWGASLNFGYVPAYGKFTVLGNWLMHWEGFVSSGVGVIHTTIIPRQFGDPAFSTIAIAPNVGIGGRVWINDWLALFVSVRDFIFNDHFEHTDRTGIESRFCTANSITENCADAAIDEVKDKSQTALVNNIMFMVGASFFLPTSFEYTTFR